ncbi:hypothetical protein [Streptomyces sp. NPDC049590]|uniref:hypothetical protein n=1 Tax=Streptomyces sp. NPDC049590 TaxID=3154834 RepID=UPI003429F7BA
MAVREPGSDDGQRPVPREMPDQQTGAEDGRWDVATPERPADETPGEGGQDAAPDTTVPDTDEAGTGRRGAPRTGAVHPEHPGPDESPG